MTHGYGGMGKWKERAAGAIKKRAEYKKEKDAKKAERRSLSSEKRTARSEKRAAVKAKRTERGMKRSFNKVDRKTGEPGGHAAAASYAKKQYATPEQKTADRTEKKEARHAKRTARRDARQS